MPTKKKISAKASGENLKEEDQASLVRQVVEVVEEKEENQGEEPLATIKQDAKEIEEAVEELEQEVVEEKEKKDVVEELFTPHEPSVMPEISMHTRSTPRTMVIWGAIVIGVALLTGGILMTIAGGGPGQVKFSFGSTPSPTPTETPTPTPTPPDTSSLTRGDLTIQVLNGGGTVGAASKMKKLLEDKGYKVTSVGNTDEYTYENTEILVKSAKAAYGELLKEDLKDVYTIDKVDTALPDDAPADARVIVGK